MSRKSQALLNDSSILDSWLSITKNRTLHMLKK